jgi:hypothetical protein
MAYEFGESGQAFLRRFFEMDEAGHNFFCKAFIPPLRFESLVDAVMPPSDGLKVLLIDGHPRTGKTWMAAAAVAAASDQCKLQPDEWWTTGTDSLLLSGASENLPSAFDEVAKSVKSRRGLKLILLNDLLGTNSLRDFGPPSKRNKLKRFLQWDKNNPWLSTLTQGATLIMVERAMFFTLAEILLGVDIRGFEGRGGRSSGVKFELWRHGLFRDREDGKPLGAFDSTNLERVLENNRTMHPLRSDEGKGQGKEWRNARVFSNAPMVAFDSRLWRKRIKKNLPDDKEGFTDDEKNIASWSVFGTDLKVLARAIEGLDASSGRNGQALGELSKLYLFLLAPALVFLGHNAHQSLGLEMREAERFGDRLYMSFTGEESGRHIASGRIPNEFYVWTLREHLRGKLPLLVRVGQRVISKLPQLSSEEKKQAERITGLLVRGILERALERGESMLRQVRAERPAWLRLTESLGEDVDALLLIEGIKGDYQVERQRLTPGLAAAIGWIRYRFFYNKLLLGEEVREWFKENLPALIGQYGNGDGDVEHRWDDLIGSFSPLLQWSIRGWREKRGNPRELEEVDEIRRSMFSSELPELEDVGEVGKDLLRMVIEDELAWGLVYEATESLETENWSDPGVQDLLLETFQFLEERPGPRVGTSASPWRLVNRFFSLAWHNEWMPIADGRIKGDVNFSRRARDYFDAFRVEALDYLRREEGLLDRNLQYHWIHFVTQHAVWMREWCFRLDPDEYERRRGAPGSTQDSDNVDLVETFSVLLKGNPSGQRVRNILFLAGTRAGRMPALEFLTKSVDELLQVTENDRSAVEVGILQAIFELLRQGYYDRFGETAQRSSSGRHWNKWSNERFHQLRNVRDEAWATYWNELERLSHRFDLLPFKTRGWEPMIPWHWRQD